MITYIYKITSEINNKVYIGSSCDYDRRVKEHLNELTKRKHNNMHLQNAFNMYGKDEFIFEVIDEIDGSRKDGYELEQKYINNYILEFGFRNMYNISVKSKGICICNLNDISVYDYRGVLVDNGDSVEISARYNITIKRLHRHCKILSKHTNGYAFRYKKDFFDEYDEDMRDYNRVVLLDSLGNFIKEYLKISDANKEIGRPNGSIKASIEGNWKLRDGRYFTFSFNYDFNKQHIIVEPTRDLVIDKLVKNEIGFDSYLLKFQLADVTGRVIGTFNTLKEISDYTSISNNTIRTNLWVHKKNNYNTYSYLHEKYIIHITTPIELVEIVQHNLTYYEALDSTENVVMITSNLKEILLCIDISYDRWLSLCKKGKDITKINGFKIRYYNFTL